MTLEDYYYYAGSGGTAGSFPPVGGGNTFAETVLGLTPTAYWRLGESSGAPQDSSGNAHHLSVSGSPTYGVAGWAGDGGTGMTFDSTSCLFASDNAAWDMGTGDFSVMFAMKMASWPAADAQAIGHDGGGTAGEWEVYTRTSLANDLTVSVGNTNTYNLSSGIALADGSWRLVIITWARSSNVTLYVDGASQEALDISATSATDLTNTAALRLAGRGVGSRPWPGSLCEMAVWKGTALTSTNVIALYAARDVV